VPDVLISVKNDDALHCGRHAGVNEKDVDVTLKDNMLTITGMVDASMYNQLAPLYTEYNVANYNRSSHSTRRSTTRASRPAWQWRARSRAAKREQANPAQDPGARAGSCMLKRGSRLDAVGFIAWSALIRWSAAPATLLRRSISRQASSTVR